MVGEEVVSCEGMLTVAVSSWVGSMNAPAVAVKTADTVLYWGGSPVALTPGRLFPGKLQPAAPTTATARTINVNDRNFMDGYLCSHSTRL